MSSYFILLRTIRRFLNDNNRTFHDMLINTGIDAQYVDKYAIVEDRSVFLVE